MGFLRSIISDSTPKTQQAVYKTPAEKRIPESTVSSTPIIDIPVESPFEDSQTGLSEISPQAPEILHEKAIVSSEPTLKNREETQDEMVKPVEDHRNILYEKGKLVENQRNIPFEKHKPVEYHKDIPFDISPLSEPVEPDPVIHTKEIYTSKQQNTKISAHIREGLLRAVEEATSEEKVKTPIRAEGYQIRAEGHQNVKTPIIPEGYQKGIIKPPLEKDVETKKGVRPLSTREITSNDREEPVRIYRRPIKGKKSSEQQKTRIPLAEKVSSPGEARKDVSESTRPEKVKERNYTKVKEKVKEEDKKATDLLSSLVKSERIQNTPNRGASDPANNNKSLKVPTRAVSSESYRPDPFEKPSCFIKNNEQGMLKKASENKPESFTQNQGPVLSIGRIDIIVEAPVNSREKGGSNRHSSNPVSANFESAHYLRRL